MRRRVVIEADGGSRGNPGRAAYGAVLKDADTGEVIAERGETIGVATNNVAEYQGLIAGLELAAEHATGADVEVRMDSKLVVEQMSGRWRIKHPDMKPLALRAKRLAPEDTTYIWVPREQNKHADRLVNEALDGKRDASGPMRAIGGGEGSASPERPAGAGSRGSSQVRPRPSTSGEPPVVEEGRQRRSPSPRPARGWSPPGSEPTTLMLVRHGSTPHTAGKLFSGGLAGADPSLDDEGRAQVRSVGEWLGPLAERIDAVVTSPVRRTRESAEILAEFLDQPLEVEDGIAEMEFGAWEGLSFTEVHQRHPDDLAAWLGDLDYAPVGGESFRAVEKRVLAGRDRILSAHAGRTVAVVSHVTPIKVLVADALGAPLEAVFRMEMAPASVTVISYFTTEDDRPRANLRLFNARPLL